MASEICNCFEPCYSNKKWRSELKVHPDTQDRTTAEWRDLLCLIDEAANDQREVFAPAKDLGVNAWQKISTLPSEISKLKNVKHLLLYGSNLTWLPPEIGDMESLAEFTPYTSYKLHWFPFEITYCKNLKASTVSTRALYGNYKFRTPFPSLRGNPVDLYRERAKCSICRCETSDRELNQVWISLKVATDVLPLLVHTCSKECLQQLPTGAVNYITETHKGGLGLAQPPKEW